MPQTVVVGVDGSEESVHALRWAADHVRQVGGILHVITIWHQPVQFGYHLTDSDAQLQKQGQQALDRALDRVKPEFPNVDFRPKLLRGHPVDEFVKLSEQADLLVVGGKGHGAFAGMLLGSIAVKIVHHARCPVTVVR
ncbi:universal stress protein [Saccharopolyspora rhizosphaerae]|uniref:Universal stress protein n=1 Tax=Saccharopolyspora rhizosphaerae TaxID=2492662 RepID=A0A3R8VIL0_9PSEU|nr:universal stress protein [Saccharopolyspora rhizosphaerae]RRO18346.1 universal stress protein [Saccharopolyspora rhizosphaerae]